MTCQQRAEYLAQTYSDAILRLSYTYLKNTSDAQDICQSVFVKLLTQPQEFESVEHERAYILRMAANACKDLLKSPWRKRTCGLEACGDLPAPQAEEGSVLSAGNELPALPVRNLSVLLRGVFGRRDRHDPGDSPGHGAYPFGPGQRKTTGNSGRSRR